MYDFITMHNIDTQHNMIKAKINYSICDYTQLCHRGFSNKVMFPTRTETKPVFSNLTSIADIC